MIFFKCPSFILGDRRERCRSRFDVVTLQCWALLDWSNISGMSWLSVQEERQPVCYGF